MNHEHDHEHHTHAERHAHDKHEHAHEQVNHAGHSGEAKPVEKAAVSPGDIPSETKTKKQQRQAEREARKLAYDQNKAAKALTADTERMARVAIRIEAKAACDARRVAKVEARAKKASDALTKFALQKEKTEERITRRNQNRVALLQAEMDRRTQRDIRREVREALIIKGVKKPGRNSKIGNCWELIELLIASHDGAFPSFKTFKHHAEGFSHAEVGLPVTQATAYYDYRIYHGVTGRIVDAKGAV